jgi:hypothetical protein
MSVTADGLTEYARSIDALSAELSESLRGAAAGTADQVAAGIRATAASRGWELANEVHVNHDPDRGFYRVTIKPRPPRPLNLPIWLEYGTVKMHARPYVRPQVQRADATYPAKVDAAIQAAADATVNR